jgi:hypothetical protein
MTPFDEFWAAYPRREKKQAARDAFAWAMKKHNADGDLLARILDTLAWQGQAHPDVRYWQMADKWLLGCRWEDERPESPAERESRMALAAAEAEFQKWKAQGHPAYTPFATFQEFRDRRRA